MTMQNALIRLIGGAALAAALAGTAAAQEVTLKLHQFLPAQANVPKLILDVWADRVEDASDGRIAIDRYPSMQLGGTPPELMDPAIDGVADIVWTVVGYTPGRFPTTEVFELPFMVPDAGAASYAFWKMFEDGMRDGEFSDLHVLGTWVHGPGVIHSAEPVASIDDMTGLKVRGPSRLTNRLIERLGATPVGMPVPAIPEALSKGVIDGAVIPWEVTGSLRVPELVEFHTEFEGNMLYTITFVLAMNKDAYAALSPENRAVIDANSGLEFSVFAGRTHAAADAPARAAALEAGNEVITITDTAPWREATQPIYNEWIAEMAEKGLDGQALIDQARALMDEYDG